MFLGFYILEITHRHQVEVITIHHGVSILFVRHHNLPNWALGTFTKHQVMNEAEDERHDVTTEKEIYLCVDQFIEGVEFMFPQLESVLSASLTTDGIEECGFYGVFPPFGTNPLKFLPNSVLHQRLLGIIQSITISNDVEDTMAVDNNAGMNRDRDRELNEFCEMLSQVDAENIHQQQYFDHITWGALMGSVSTITMKDIVQYLSIDYQDFESCQNHNFQCYYM